MKKIDKGNLLRLLAYILFSLYITFNGIKIDIGNFKFYVNGLLKSEIPK